MKLFIMSGLPGSGKSTYARSLNIDIVSLDVIRNSGGHKNERYVKKEYYRNIENLLKEGKDAVADATHLTVMSRSKVISIGKKYNYEIIIIKMVTPFSTCLERNSKRDDKDKVPSTVILDMLKRTEDIDKEVELVDSVIYSLGNQ